MLKKSRSGQYAHVGHYHTISHIPMPWDDLSTARKQVLSGAKAYVNIEDKDEKEIGDAVKIASEAIQAWQDFIFKHNLGV